MAFYADETPLAEPETIGGGPTEAQRAEIAESGRIVELEASKAPVGSTGKLTVPPVKQKKVKGANAFPVHIFIDTETGKYKFVNSAEERDDLAKLLQSNKDRYRMYRAEEITPQINITWNEAA